MKFKQLSVGDTFTFESERTMPYSGMMKGPWVKIGPRSYVLADDKTFTCHVGSINTVVDKR